MADEVGGGRVTTVGAPRPGVWVPVHLLARNVARAFTSATPSASPTTKPRRPSWLRPFFLSLQHLSPPKFDVARGSRCRCPPAQHVQRRYCSSSLFANLTSSTHHHLECAPQPHPPSARRKASFIRLPWTWRRPSSASGPNAALTTRRIQTTALGGRRLTGRRTSTSRSRTSTAAMAAGAAAEAGGRVVGAPRAAVSEKLAARLPALMRSLQAQGPARRSPPAAAGPTTSHPRPPRPWRDRRRRRPRKLVRRRPRSALLRRRSPRR